MFFVYMLIGLLIAGNLHAQNIERTGEKDYVISQSVSKNLDDQQRHCEKLKVEIDRLIDQSNQCEAEVGEVVKQEPPKADGLNLDEAVIP